MKKVFYLFALIAFTLTSCDNTNNVENLQITDGIRFGGLKVSLPSGYDKSVLSLDLTDLQNQFYSSKTGGSSKVKSSEYTNITFERMAILAEEVISKYPNIDSLTAADIALIKHDFIGIDDETIENNIEIIESFYTALIRYDLVKVLSQKNTTPLKAKSVVSNDYFGYEMNSSEFWYFVWHPALAKPIQNATSKANELTATKFPSSSRYQDKGDAFRHAIWNALMAKYIGLDKNNVADCIDRAKDFSDLHESGGQKPGNMTDEQYKLDGQMDYHNNGQGRNYFVSVAWIIKEGFFKVKRVRAPSEEQMANDILELTKTAKKVVTVSDINSNPNNLVHIVD